MNQNPSQESGKASIKEKFLRVVKAIGLVLLYLIAWLTVSIILLLVAKKILGERISSLDAASEMGYEGIFMAFAVAIVNIIFIYSFKLKAAGEGWPGIRSSLSGFGNGALVGLGMSGGMFVLTIIMGGGAFSLDGNSWSEYFLRITPLLLFVLVSTLGEEWLFRGYPITVLAKATNPGWENLFLAIIFAFIHVSSSGFNGLVAFNIVIGSLVVGALRFTKGGIPCAWGFHFAWNGLQVVAGSTLTGIDMSVPVLHYNGKGQDWLSGGALGPEGGVGAMVATLIVLVFITKYFWRKKIYNLPLPFGVFIRKVNTSK